MKIKEEKKWDENNVVREKKNRDGESERKIHSDEI